MFLSCLQRSPTAQCFSFCPLFSIAPTTLYQVTNTSQATVNSHCWPNTAKESQYQQDVDPRILINQQQPQQPPHKDTQEGGIDDSSLPDHASGVTNDWSHSEPADPDLASVPNASNLPGYYEVTKSSPDPAVPADPAASASPQGYHTVTVNRADPPSSFTSASSFSRNRPSKSSDNAGKRSRGRPKGSKDTYKRPTKQENEKRRAEAPKKPVGRPHKPDADLKHPRRFRKKEYKTNRMDAPIIPVKNSHTASRLTAPAPLVGSSVAIDQQAPLPSYNTITPFPPSPRSAFRNTTTTTIHQAGAPAPKNCGSQRSNRQDTSVLSTIPEGQHPPGASLEAACLLSSSEPTRMPVPEVQNLFHPRPGYESSDALLASQVRNEHELRSMGADPFTNARGQEKL